MKMLVHRTPVSEAAAVDLADVKLHIRVGHELEDAAIADMISAATAEVEHFAQIAMLTQTIRVNIFDPLPESFLRLPIGPAAENETPTVTIDGAAFTDFALVGGNRPGINWQLPYFDLCPSRITIEYTAGFGDAASAVPADLRQAIMDQAGLYYDSRSPMDGKSLTTSPHMARIGARYRGVSM